MLHSYVQFVLEKAWETHGPCKEKFSKAFKLFLKRSSIGIRKQESRSTLTFKKNMEILFKRFLFILKSTVLYQKSI